VESALRELAPGDLKVIETLGYLPGTGRDTGFRRLARHLARAARTCARLGIPFDLAAAEAALSSAVQTLPPQAELVRCRLTVDRDGRLEASAAVAAPAPARWRAMIGATRLQAGDPWLGIKTSQRRLYDETRAQLPPGIDEVIFLNEAGEVCEGTITNVFLRLDGDPDGPLATPPLACGLLPGILREELLASGAAVEGVLTLDDLRRAAAVFLGNSLRGLIPADIVREP
jgi:4-amino-4-deoxychorismate lyase